MPDGTQRRAADLADALGDRIGHGIDLIGLLIQQQVVVAEVRAAHVPVKILGLQVQREHIGQDAVHPAFDALGRGGAQIGGRDQRRLAALLQVGLLCAAHGIIPTTPKLTYAMRNFNARTAGPGPGRP